MAPLPDHYVSTALVAALGATVATPLLARLAPRLGWTDAAAGPLAARKTQGRPVPAVGGAALLLGAGVALLAEGAEGSGGALLLGTGGAEGGAMIASLAGLFLVGLLDDRRAGGLSPGRKLGGQALALLPLAVAFALGQGSAGPLVAALAGVGLLGGGLVAVNALNTFDNADGALGGVCLLGFAGPMPALGGALLGFLPWNLNAREGRARDPGATPTAYLGDAGSHALGLLVLLTPPAWPVLLLPLLDLARLAVVRLRAGSRPWVGDRRHLAHRLAARGFSRPGVAVLLALVAAPGCGGGAWAWLGGRPPVFPLLAGGLGTAFLFLLAVRGSREPAPGGRE